MEQTIETNKRSFVGPDDVSTYYIVPPNAEAIRGADWQYSKTYTKCLVEGITTAAEMRDILTRRGIIGHEFEQRMQELTEDLAVKLDILENSTDIDSKRDTAVDVALAREELYEWNQRLNGPLSNTCENIADDARLEFLTSNMVEDSSGNKVWENYALYLKNKDQDLASKAKFETMLYLQGLDSEFLDNTPEAVAMREVETEILSKAQVALEAMEDTTKDLKKESKNNTKKSSKSSSTKKSTKVTKKKNSKSTITKKL